MLIGRELFKASPALSPNGRFPGTLFNNNDGGVLLFHP